MLTRRTVSPGRLRPMIWMTSSPSSLNRKSPSACTSTRKRLATMGRWSRMSNAARLGMHPPLAVRHQSASFFTFGLRNSVVASTALSTMSVMRVRSVFPTSPRLHPEDLARVHDVVGIERELQLPHHRDAVAMLGRKEIQLAVADPVLAGAGAAEAQRAQHHALVDALRLGHLGGILRIDDEGDVEVAVADMAHDRSHQRRGADVGLGLRDAFG